MSLNYNFIETIKLFIICFKQPIFLALIVSMFIMLLLIIYNKDSKKIKYITLIINSLLSILLLFFYLKNIISFRFNNPINNLYFYIFNSIIYMLLFSYISFKKNIKIIDYIFYSIFLIGILFSLYMTYYFNNSNILVIGNIFPIIKFGNILYIIYYIVLLLRQCVFLTKKK